MPFVPSDDESLADGVRLVDELAFVVESAAIVSDDDTSTLSQNEILFSVDFKADVNFALVEKSDLWEVVQLIVKDGHGLLKPRLQGTESVDHKVPIWLIVPTIVAMF
jgi:hypothetical protein